MRLTLNQRIALFEIAADREVDAAWATLRSLRDRGLICKGPRWQDHKWVLTAAGVAAIDQERRLAALAARRAERKP